MNIINAISENMDIVALNTTKASATALFEIDNGVHQYIYISGNNVYRATANEDGSLEDAKDVKLCGGASGKTLEEIRNYILSLEVK